MPYPACAIRGNELPFRLCIALESVSRFSRLAIDTKRYSVGAHVGVWCACFRHAIRYLPQRHNTSIAITSDGNCM